MGSWHSESPLQMPHSEKVSFLAGETTRCCIASADAGTLANIADCPWSIRWVMTTPESDWLLVDPRIDLSFKNIQDISISLLDFPCFYPKDRVAGAIGIKCLKVLVKALKIAPEEVNCAKPSVTFLWFSPAHSGAFFARTFQTCLQLVSACISVEISSWLGTDKAWRLLVVVLKAWALWKNMEKSTAWI